MANKKVTLKFKGKDFTETDYTNSNDCAITRALKRAGYEDYVHDGFGLVNNVTLNYLGMPEADYDKMHDRVQNMYQLKEKPKNWQITTTLTPEY